MGIKSAIQAAACAAIGALPPPLVRAGCRTIAVTKRGGRAAIALAARYPLSAIAVVAFALFFIVDLRGVKTLAAIMLFPAPEESAPARLAFALIAALLLAANVFVIRALPRFFMRVLAVWIELLLLFLLFFYSFDLSYEFIGRKIGFLIARGATTTILVSLTAIALASGLAMVLAVAKMSRNALAYGASTFYISFFRGLPLLMQVWLIYLGLPQLGFVIEAVPAGIAALTVCYSAYMAEIFRAGIQSIPRGQWEAAASMGLSWWSTFRLVILPQAIKIVVPPTGNQFIAMLKDSSLVSVIGVWELTFLARTQGKSEFKHLEMLITASLIYWILSIAFELVQARIERHYGKSAAGMH